MPAYDSSQFDPPAPIAQVTLVNPANGTALTDVPMQIDSGADVTLLPRAVVEKLGIAPLASQYQVAGFDGSIRQVQIVYLEMTFLSRTFRGQFPVIDQAIGILGRNVMNKVALVFDGPRTSWYELQLGK